jgi:FtsH-binding integral membrane protein
VIVGALFIALAVLIAVLVFGFTPGLNAVAAIIAGVGILVLLGVAIYSLQRGIRRWVWRRGHIAETGGRYLRAWETYPPREG